MTDSVYPVITKEKSLPFYLTGIGITNPEYHIKRDIGLTSHQFLLTKSGAGVLKLEQNVLILKPGDILYLPPHFSHEYFPQNGDWQTFWLVFRGENIDSLMKKLGFEKSLFYSFIENNFQTVESSFLRLFKLSKNHYDGEKCSLLLYDYILLIRKLIFSDEKTVHPGVKAALFLMERNYMEDLTIEQLSKAAGLSVQHFCRIFKKSMGMRPLEFLAKKRISVAKTLLEKQEFSIAQVGQAVGYKDLNYFGIVFRSQEGIAPSLWKKNQ